MAPGFLSQIHKTVFERMDKGKPRAAPSSGEDHKISLMMNYCQEKYITLW